MKRILLLLSLLISYQIFSQVKKPEIGLKIGLNVSQFSPDIELSTFTFDPIDFRGKVGYYFGVFINGKISDRFSYQPELVFANQGTNRSFLTGFGSDEIAPAESSIRDLTLSVPIFIQYSLTNRFFIEGAPRFSYVVNRVDIVRESFFNNEGDRIELSEFLPDFDRFDLGFTIGIGFNLAKKILINLRYSLSILERDDLYRSSVVDFGLNFKL